MPRSRGLHVIDAAGHRHVFNPAMRGVMETDAADVRVVVGADIQFANHHIHSGKTHVQASLFGGDHCGDRSCKTLDDRAAIRGRRRLIVYPGLHRK